MQDNRDLMKSPADYTVKISVDDNGNFSYQNAVVRVQAGDSVAWECAHSFSVSFQRTPFNSTVFHSHNGGSLGKTTGSETVQGPLGVYHYAVAVAKNDKVWINSGCPEVDVG